MLLSWLLAPAFAATLPAAASFAVEAEVHALPNGVPVVLAAEAGAGQITAQWLFAAGAATDPPEHHGLAHLVEHLAFGVVGPARYDARLGELGGRSDGWTDRERSGLGATLPSEEGALAGLLALEGERVHSLLIDEASIARQRAIIAEEHAEIADSAHGLDRVWLDALLWLAGEPWAEHPQGAPRESVTVAEAQAAWAARFTPGQAVLVLAGDFNLAAARAGLQPAPPTPPRPTPASLGEPGCEPAAPANRWTRANVAEGAVVAAWPIPGRDHPDRIALEAIARFIGGARVSTGAGCGELTVERDGGPWRTAESLRSLRAAVAAIAAGGLPEVQLAPLRVAALTDLARARSFLEVRARVLAACQLGQGRTDCLESEAQAWLDLTPTQLAGAARRWLDPVALTALAVLPPTAWFGPVGMRRWGGP